MRHGFESVHERLHKNFGELSDVLGRYGLQMSRSAARQKAEQWTDEPVCGTAEGRAIACRTLARTGSSPVRPLPPARRLLESDRLQKGAPRGILEPWLRTSPPDLASRAVSREFVRA